MIKKYGSEEKWREHMAKNGRKGGLIKTPTGGFGSDLVGEDGLTGLERARVVGAKGGRTSRRTVFHKYDPSKDSRKK
jgi:hypothetical protein